MEEILLRMIFGGLFVSVFALLGDILKPKRFAGLFGAAPSVALATLTLTAVTQGKAYAATEARSMIGGAIAFVVYSVVVHHILFRHKSSAFVVTLLSIPLWFLTSFAIWFAWLR